MPICCVSLILRLLRQDQDDKLRDVMVSHAMVSLSNHEPSFDKLMTGLAPGRF